jgi:hypothetical protein
MIFHGYRLDQHFAILHLNVQVHLTCLWLQGNSEVHTLLVSVLPLEKVGRGFEVIGLIRREDDSIRVVLASVVSKYSLNMTIFILFSNALRFRKPPIHSAIVCFVPTAPNKNTRKERA